MKRVAVSLALAFSAGLVMACPGSKDEMNAQAPAAEKLAALTAQPAAAPAPTQTTGKQPTLRPLNKPAGSTAPAAEPAKKSTGV